jgi:uncharacterized protein YbgA (DUF1722 family)/uncharacterized protein YbbK (DUF523 family)
MSKRLRIGVSACLTGAAVRFDGGHKHDDFVTGLDAELVSVCPELELGLGAPRESLRLIRRGPDVSLVAPRSQRDLTAEMRGLARKRVAALGDLDGFIVKKDSPTCGLERVRVYPPNGIPVREGRGLFTAELVAAWPLLPVEEEGRLRDPDLRTNFLVRVHVHHRLRHLFAQNWRRGELVAFHASIKLELMAHAPAAARQLGRLVAHLDELSPGDAALRYHQGVMQALALVPSRGRHVNVLQHVAGYFSSQLADDERRELCELIADYQGERAPRSTPLTLLRHHALRSRHPWLAQQTYLQKGAS